MMKLKVSRIIHTIVCMTVILTLSLPLTAFVPHEDPEKAEIIYDSITLFRYYSEILDHVLAGNQGEASIKIERMPLANLPDSLRTTTDDLTSSMYDISRLLIDIDHDILELNSLLRQQRFVEVVPLSITIRQNIATAALNLNTIEDSIIVTGDTFNVFAVPEESSLRIAYDEVIEKIAVIRRLLEAYLKMLSGVIDIEAEIIYNDDAHLWSLIPVDITVIDELIKGSGSDNVTKLQSLIPTEVTLHIEPMTIFVGENVTVSGRLQSENLPLDDRQVHIFLNNTEYLSVKTDGTGCYQTLLTIPYWYNSEINVRAIYYPEDEDIGVYLSSLSPELTISALFYSTELTIQTSPKSYPGMETTISGRFEYIYVPPLIQREIEVYLDNILIVTTEVSNEFSMVINLDDEINTGKYTITVSTPGIKRYAPVVAYTTINVTKALPILTMDLPHVIIIPGKFELSGKLESEVGQLKNADIAVNLNKTSVVTRSSNDGTFESTLEMKMGFELVGSESLEIHILPEEPWHDVLTISKKVLVLNIINCVVFLTVIVVVGIFISGKLRPGIRFYRRAKPQPVSTLFPDQTSIPTYDDTIITTNLPSTISSEEVEPNYRIYSWYESLLKIIQKTTSSLLRPNQTLREFATNTKKGLGPVAELFMEFTKIIERLLYSRHRATDPEVEKSKQIADRIERELKL